MIDLIIPHFGNNDLLNRCLKSIRENVSLDYHIHIIDNNVPDEPAIEPASDVTYHQPEENLGFARAVNLAIKASQGEYVLLLNNDVVVPVGCIESLLSILEDDPDIAAVGPLSTARTQWQWIHNMAMRLGRDLPTNDYVYQSGLYIPKQTDDPRYVKFPGGLAFWCTLIPRHMFDAVGLLDERFFIYAEDDDWCLRALQAGYKTALDLSMVVQHDHRQGYSAEVEQIHRESFQKLKDKWQTSIRQPANVLVGILNQGTIRTEMVAFLMEMSAKRRSDLGHINVSFSDLKPIAHNRNTLVKDMLDSDWDYLLQMDNDTLPLGDPLDLVSWDLDIIGFPTPIYNVRVNPNMPIYWNVGRWNDTNWNTLKLNLDEGLVEVDAVGTGVMLVARRVFEHPALRGPFMRSFDEDGIAVRGLDFEFCRRAREVGFKCYIHTDYIADHFKEVSLMKMWELISKHPDEIVGNGPIIDQEVMELKPSLA